jgi:hypothetical protein
MQVESHESYRFEELVKKVICSEELDNWIVLRELLENKELKSKPKIHESMLRALESKAMTS